MGGIHDEEIESLRLFAENRLLSRDITGYEAAMIQRTIVALVCHDRVTEFLTARVAALEWELAVERRRLNFWRLATNILLALSIWLIP